MSSSVKIGTQAQLLEPDRDQARPERSGCEVSTQYAYSWSEREDAGGS